MSAYSLPRGAHLLHIEGSAEQRFTIVTTHVMSAYSLTRGAHLLYIEGSAEQRFWILIYVRYGAQARSRTLKQKHWLGFISLSYMYMGCQELCFISVSYMYMGC